MISFFSCELLNNQLLHDAQGSLERANTESRGKYLAVICAAVAAVTVATMMEKKKIKEMLLEEEIA